MIPRTAFETGKVVQYRCYSCKRLLYKVEVKPNEKQELIPHTLFTAPGLEAKQSKSGIMLLKCTKCGVINGMRKGELAPYDEKKEKAKV